MVQIQAGIHHGNPHSLTGITQVFPGQRRAKGLLCRIHIGIGHCTAGGHILRQVIPRRNKSSLYAIQITDFLQSPIRSLQRHTVYSHLIVIFHPERRFLFFQGEIVHNPADALKHRLLAPLHRLRLPHHRSIGGGNLSRGEPLLQQGRLFQYHDDPYLLLRLVQVLRKRLGF